MVSSTKGKRMKREPFEQNGRLFRNITERKRSEKDLRKREESFRTLVENSPDIIERFDKEIRHVYVNPLAAKLHGAPAEALIGKTNQEIGVAEQYWRFWEERIQRVFKTGETMEEENEFPTTSGVRIYQSHLVPEKDEDGSVTSVLMVSRDITERKRAEEALQRSQQLFSSIFRTNPAATILSWLADGKCVDANEAYAKLVGYTREELIGRTTVELSIWISAEERRRVVTELAEKGHLENVELTLRKKNGDIINTVASGEVFNLDGQQYILSFFFDITDRKRTEEALRERTLDLQHLTETLEERVRERTAEIADLSSRLVSVQETERKRISYDLHDNVWQNLSNLNFMLKRFLSGGSDETPVESQEQVRRIISCAEAAIEKIRMMQGDLWPYVLDDVGILATVKWYCREFEKNHPRLLIDTQIDITEEEVPVPVKIIIYRVIQEAFEKHFGA